MLRPRLERPSLGLRHACEDEEEGACVDGGVDDETASLAHRVGEREEGAQYMCACVKSDRRRARPPPCRSYKNWELYLYPRYIVPCDGACQEVLPDMRHAFCEAARIVDACGLGPLRIAEWMS